LRLRVACRGAQAYGLVSAAGGRLLLQAIARKEANCAL